jgi:cell division septation protein DedD
MPWPSNGDYYGFKEEAIKFQAPSVSGVYGIYNFKHHILIGHSNNIREALLRHHRETKFRFRRLQPTGFTFEACPVDLREFRMRQLVSEYQPITHSDDNIGVAAWWRSWTARRATACYPHVGALKQPGEDDRNQRSVKTAGKNHVGNTGVRRGQFAMLSSGFAFMIVAIALFVLTAENKTVAESFTRQVLSLAHNLTSSLDQNTQLASLTQAQRAAVADDATTQKTATLEPASESQTEQQVASATEPPEQNSSAAARSELANGPASIGKKSTATTIIKKEPPRSQTAKREESPPLWGVQALASTDKADATVWLDRLKAKGYDAFMVEANINGHTWYRVRVGNVQTRQEAEALRKILQSKEGFRDAFVTSNTKPAVVLAANGR